MYYCEKCKQLCSIDYCDNCGNKEIRSAEDNDFCFIAENDEMYSKMLADILENNDIKCVMIPDGNGVRSAMGMTLGKYKIYVMYKHYSMAESIISAFFQNGAETMKNDLITNRQLWNISSKTAKKLCKKYKIKDVNELFEFIQKGVCDASNICDGGLISSCASGGHYIFVKGNNFSVCFNSATYEIFI